MQAYISDNDDARIEALHSYDIIDTVREEAFDDIVEMASNLTQTKYSYIGFLDKERQWLKSSCHISTEFFDIPREMSFCNYTVYKEEVIVVEDTLNDPVFKDKSGVVGEPFIRFYCGIPIVNKEKFVLGTLCILDTKPRNISDTEISYLKYLASLVINQLELRKNITSLKNMRKNEENEIQKFHDRLSWILPKKIALEFIETSKVTPKYIESTTILFASFHQPKSEIKDPASEVGNIQQFIQAFDEINETLKIEKIKTMSEVYMSVCGAPMQDRAHMLRQCMSALQFKHYLNKDNKHRHKLNLSPYVIKMGLYSGAVIGALVGKTKFLYDLWGDSVNRAKRITENCEDNRIEVSEEIYFKMKEYFEFDKKDLVEIKHMEPFNIYSLKRYKKEFSLDVTGILPNEHMVKLLESF